MKPTLDYPTAVDLLRHPATWKKGARALARLGDARALLHLARAYELPVETSRLALLDAMGRLGAEHAAAGLFASAADDEARRLALHLMELFPHAAHLPLLAQAARCDSPALRRQAARSLVCQPQSTAWAQALKSLLDAPDEQVRGWAAEGLRLAGIEPGV